MYGFTSGAPYEAARPLSNDTNWFFHGYQDDEPEDVCELKAGETFVAEVACNRRWTSYGSDTTDPSDPVSACPDRQAAACTSARSSSMLTVFDSQRKLVSCQSVSVSHSGIRESVFICVSQLWMASNGRTSLDALLQLRIQTM